MANPSDVNFTSYDTFRASVLGKGYDMDGYYGYQCWDGADLLWWHDGRRLETGNGYAYGCWTLKRDVNSGGNFTLVPDKTQIKRGDIVVFDVAFAPPTGHIAYADEDYKGSGFNCMGQNQVNPSASAGSPFAVSKLGVVHILGAFRYTPWVERPKPPKKKKKKFPWFIYTNKIRNRTML